MRPIILASTSPYRERLLRQLQIPFQAAPPEYAEERGLNLPPPELVCHLASQKALSLQKKFPQALIIGSDQILVIDDTIIGKPGTEERAIEQLRKLSGRWGSFYTGLTVLDASTGRKESGCEVFRVKLRRLPKEIISRYVKREQPLNCAGSFQVEGLGIALMEKLAGNDYTSLIGLPLIRLVAFLEVFGVTVL